VTRVDDNDAFPTSGQRSDSWGRMRRPASSTLPDFQDAPRGRDAALGSPRGGHHRPDSRLTRRGSTRCLHLITQSAPSARAPV